MKFCFARSLAGFAEIEFQSDNDFLLLISQMLHFKYYKRYYDVSMQDILI